MSDPSPSSGIMNWIGGLRTMPNEHPVKIVVVAVLLSLVCSVAVTGTAVLLKPAQERNSLLAQKRQILKVAGLWRDGESIDTLFRQIQTRMVDLESGNYVETGAQGGDRTPSAIAHAQYIDIAPADDIARIKRRARHKEVYLVGQDNDIKTIILPIRGYGLWSTMRGFIALAGDGHTVRGITFYEHAETPGLGSQIDDARWQKKWADKQVYDTEGAVRLSVVKGVVDPGASDAKYRIDGLSGATLTGNGVTNMIHYWLGQNGYGPYLERIRKQAR